MENLMFVVWLLGWPLVCSVTDKIGPWEGAAGAGRIQGDETVVALVRIIVWLGVALLLYRP